MSSKRTAVDEIDSRPPKSKRHNNTRTDLASSQRGAFGDLGNATTAPTGDGDLDCEDDSAALAYLRSVRTQASTIPHVIAAKKAGPSLPPPVVSDEDDDEGAVDRTIYGDGVGDFRGYYQDGAYVAYPEGYWDKAEDGGEDYEEGEEGDAGYENELDTPESTDSRPHNSSADEIRDSYFASIMTRYLTLRKLMQSTPPESAIRALPATNSTEVEPWSRTVNTFQRWGARLRETDPLPAQIAAMHKDSVFRLLHIILASNFIRRRTQIHERTSRWIWALLARVPEVGELDYMEVGRIRELGKRAVLMLVSLAEVELLREHCDVEGSSIGDQDQGEYEVGVEVDEFYEDDPDQDDALYAPTSGAIKERAAGSNTPVMTHPTDQPHLEVGDDAEASDVDMQLDSSDLEDGEVADAAPSPSPSEPLADIAAAKAQLLTQITSFGEVEKRDSSISATPPVPHESATPQETVGEETSQLADAPIAEEGEYEEDADDEDRYKEPDRATANERATLNMILTVAGEFYGQRDLLEFRDPFGGLQFE